MTTLNLFEINTKILNQLVEQGEIDADLQEIVDLSAMSTDATSTFMKLQIDMEAVRDGLSRLRKMDKEARRKKKNEMIGLKIPI